MGVGLGVGGIFHYCTVAFSDAAEVDVSTVLRDGFLVNVFVVSRHGREGMPRYGRVVPLVCLCLLFAVFETRASAMSCALGSRRAKISWIADNVL